MLAHVLDQLKLLSLRRFVASYEIAVVYAGLGQNSQAIAWLQKSYDTRDSSWLVELGLDPRLDPVRSDPRFQDLVRLMNFPS